MELFFDLLIMFLAFNYIRYIDKYNDKSLQGYFEYLKDKYYTKKD